MRILLFVGLCVGLGLGLGLGVRQTFAEDLLFDIRHTQDCLAEADDLVAQRVCIGSSAVACMEATPTGYTTIGMSGCTDFELSWWDGELNRAYQELRSIETAEDAEMAGLPGAGGQAEALRDMQRAWIALRDAKCLYERSQWGGGTGGGPAYVSCALHETAQQALYLQSMAMEW